MGSISRKLIGALRKARSAKVVDLGALAAGRASAEALQETVASDRALAELHPAHAVYVYVQNQLTVIVEQLSELRESARLTRLITAAEEEYLPSGPPMSPLTRSYFTCWSLFDARVGAERETFGTCVLDVGRVLGMDAALLNVIRLMQDSRTGLYQHLGVGSDGLVELRELVTERRCRAISPSGYRGTTGELWLARVLPPPAPAFTEHVVFTTPYLLIRPGIDEWQEYLARTVGTEGDAETGRRYERLMKYGLERHYWNEYIHEAYVNHEAEVIFLAGLPDVEESRPHSRANW